MKAMISAENAAGQTMIHGKQVPLQFAESNPPGYDDSTFTIKYFGFDDPVTLVATTTIESVQTTTKAVVVPTTAEARCDLV